MADTIPIQTRLVDSLDDIRKTPLDRIAADKAIDIARGVLYRGTEQTPVDVARFSSAV